MAGRTLHQDPPPLIAFRDTAEHSKRRKPWNRAFSSTSLKEYQPTVARRVDQLIGALEAQQGPVDLAQWLGYFTCANLC
jgi:cytochrome P450